jgi:hypothetical protein
MRYIDIELYRWKFHHDIYMKRKDPRFYKQNKSFTNSNVRMQYYWKELGAFISIIPRGSGKSTMLTILAKEFEKNKEKFIIVTPDAQMKGHMISMGIQNKNVISARSYDESTIIRTIGSSPIFCNLMIDEFNLLPKATLDDILGYNWKTVTMVGSL